MTQQNNENIDPQNQTSSEPGQQSAPQEPDPIKTRDQRIAELEKQVSQLNDKILLAAAEYQNVVRRSRNNVIEAREQNTMDIAKGLMQSLDLFDMALACDPKKVTADTILMGVQMVHAEMIKSLDGFGIKRVTVRPGDDFDPQRHEAVARVPGNGVASGKIASQLQCGYMLGDKTIRPAKVNVAE